MLQHKQTMVVHKDNYNSKTGKEMTIFNNLKFNHGDLNKLWEAVLRYFLPSTTFKFQNSNQSTNCLLNVLDRMFLLLAKGTWEIKKLNTKIYRGLEAEDEVKKIRFYPISLRSRKRFLNKKVTEPYSVQVFKHLQCAMHGARFCGWE